MKREKRKPKLPEGVFIYVDRLATAGTVERNASKSNDCGPLFVRVLPGRVFGVRSRKLAAFFEIVRPSGSAGDQGGIMDGDPFAQFSDGEIQAEHLRRLKASTDKLLEELDRQLDDKVLEELDRQVSVDFEDFQRKLRSGG